MPKINDINTEIPISQYLPQKQPLLLANTIENLHRDLMALLAETGQDDSQIKESLKRHFLAELNFLMESGNWKDADIKTDDLIRLAGSTEAGFEIENISCRDLSTIDRLWVERSDGTFGFSVQKTIFAISYRSQPDPFEPYHPFDLLGGVNEKRFWARVGWYEEKEAVWSYEFEMMVEQGEWLNWEEGVFNPRKAQRGHLPRLSGIGIRDYGSLLYHCD